MSSIILSFVLGIVSSLIPRIIFENYKERKDERKERKIANDKKEIICKAFIHEILMYHKPLFFNLLDAYRYNWKDGPYNESLEWVGYYPVNIYEVYRSELNPFFKHVSVQIHYYYQNIERLNIMGQISKSEMNDDFMRRYLKSAIETYGALYGVLNLLTNKPDAHQEFMMILEHVEAYGSIADRNIFLDYGRPQIAENIVDSESEKQ